MSTNPTIEHMFSGTYLKYLKESKKQQEEHVSSHVLPAEDYALSVGYIRGLNASITKFEELLKAYFAN